MSSTKAFVERNVNAAEQAFEIDRPIAVNDWSPKFGYKTFEEYYGKILGHEECSTYFKIADKIRAHTTSNKGKTIRYRLGENLHVPIFHPSGKEDKIDAGALTARRFGGYMAKLVYERIQAGDKDYLVCINKIAAKAGIEKPEKAGEAAKIYWSLAPGAESHYDSFGLYPYAHEAIKRIQPSRYNMKSKVDNYIGLHKAARMRCVDNVGASASGLITINEFLDTEEGIAALKVCVDQINKALGKSNVGEGSTRAVFAKLQGALKNILEVNE
ncbi:nucleocapsid protein [Shuangao Insect Virus 1]|uniref:Nucleocapsid protein n=1 Tax=Shuangao Insect Virus 1 TaxID=1608075 RepID=A0A0B5KS64_9VIRU|nr:nucleocapsid protein [Shuangao Insect Virus 1]AJG39311.1 nucleocapsid protein [Shuangao Insect Virus 1]